MDKRTLIALAVTTLGSRRRVERPGADRRDAPKLPRTSWGDPRIEGTYTNKDEFGTPFERPDELAGQAAPRVRPGARWRR